MSNGDVLEVSCGGYHAKLDLNRIYEDLDHLLDQPDRNTQG